MSIVPRASQKTYAMTLPANGFVFVFFGADSPLSVHCFGCSSVSDAKLWTHVLSMVMKIGFIAEKDRQTLD